MRLIRIQIFAGLKGVSRQTVHSLIKSGKLKTRKLSGMKLIVMDSTAKKWKPLPGKRNDLKRNRGEK